MDRLNQPIQVTYRDQDWFIVDKPYDCRIQDYPNTTDTSGKINMYMLKKFFVWKITVF